MHQSVARERAPFVRRLLWRAILHSRILGFLSRAAWRSAERAYEFFNEPYLPIETPLGLVRARSKLYKRERVCLRSGRRVRRGAHILDLHLNSRVAKELWRAHPGMEFLALLLVDTRAVAAYLATNPRAFVAVRARTKLQHLLRYGQRLIVIEIREQPHTLESQLEQLFQEMVILDIHPEPLKILESHYERIADGWCVPEEFIKLAANGNGPP